MSTQRTKPKPWKIERPHRKGCLALRSAAPFQTLTEPAHTVFRTYAANVSPTHRGDHYLYIRVRCNDTQCPATALFHLDTALVAIGLNDERQP
jgi:hypothetical protein